MVMKNWADSRTGHAGTLAARDLGRQSKPEPQHSRTFNDFFCRKIWHLA